MTGGGRGPDGEADQNRALAEEQQVAEVLARSEREDVLPIPQTGA